MVYWFLLFPLGSPFMTPSLQVLLYRWIQSVIG
jgi:hypothetical protein